MPLEVLGPLVVVGIGAVVLLVHLLGWSRIDVLADEAEAVAALRKDFPDLSARRVVLGDDRKAALLETDGGLGVVRALGDGRMTRVLAPGAATAAAGAGGVEIAMADFGAPGVSVRIADGLRRAEALALARRMLGEDA